MGVWCWFRWPAVLLSFWLLFVLQCAVAAPATLANEVCGCGKVRGKLSGRIIGGESVDISHFPWLAMIVKKDEVMCAGALLNDRFVLTAAHCFLSNRLKVADLRIWLGANRFLSDESQASNIFGVSEIISHPSFSQKEMANDISLIRLSQPVLFTNTIRPICLSPADILDFSGLPSILAGWGYTQEEGSPSRDLQQVTLSVINMNECFSTIRHPYLRYTNLCAGVPNGQKDACQGDSGAPLVLQRNNTWHVIGVVSWGEGCGRKGLYGIYTRVSNYTTWITSNIREGKLCTTAPNKEGPEDSHGNEVLTHSGQVGSSSSNAISKHFDHKEQLPDFKGNNVDLQGEQKTPAMSEIDVAVNRGCMPKMADIKLCGLPGRSARIVGGNVTPEDKYPWMVAVVEVCGPECLRLACGGVLVGCRWILTAAACLANRKLSSLRVAIGIHDISTLNYNSSLMTRVANAIIPADHATHNLALLLLQSSAPYGSVCLPSPLLTTESFRDKNVTALGWGRTGTNEGLSLKLKEVALPVISNDDCARVYPATVNVGVICAGQRANQSICYGDFGGPLMWENPEDGRVYLVGVASFVADDGCAQANVPVGFTRVTTYLSWMKRAFKQFGN